ncbi:NAD(P)-dependent oxidoreductase [Anaerobacillus sp. CMMVII]|uniref:NAD-dependent epimerase/dehydratase family protein n=1 Tax=Anaerobacillus sp. CMMVII TaxID=2755588 RepID=UPI0021B74BA2|nr:NAD(P)-dependent oxidoreductase [Anaerobacillus sp. CMMVII]MCT8140416.1 NAD(P)-dependent oxidoreductase [Anaerobacillus sp. CMMVII]
MNKIIVTGALGFIGFSLCQRLLEKGFEVIGIDGMVEENLTDLYEEKLLWLGRNSSFTFLNEKLEEVDLNAIFTDINVVYHLAAATSKDRKWNDLRTTIEDNVDVTGKIIAACANRIKLIFTSSTQVYGERTGIITERTPLNPNTPYSLTKMAAESLIKAKCNEFAVPYVIFRLPTIYGPWQRIDMTYSKLIVEQMTHSSKVIEDDRVTEDILYIDDILDTLVKAGIEENCKNEVYNIASGKVNEWYRGKAIICNDFSIIPTDQRLQVSISNDKVVSQLGFKVTTNLEDGLAAQKEHMQRYKHLYVK